MFQFLSSFMFLGRASSRNTTDWLLPKLYGPDYWVHYEILTNTFFMIKKIFLQNEHIVKKDLYFIFNANIFCVKIYLRNEIWFFTFPFIFFSVKKFFSVKFVFIIKLFFHIKTFFSADNVYFVKTNIFS